MTDRRFICRCEDVTVEDCLSAARGGLATVEEIKRFTGLGTGPCQGRECMVPLCELLVREGVSSPQHLRPFTARPPAEQVSLGALAAGHDAPSEEDR